jgi:hypothetical protein
MEQHSLLAAARHWWMRAWKGTKNDFEAFHAPKVKLNEPVQMTSLDKPKILICY